MRITSQGKKKRDCKMGFKENHEIKSDNHPIRTQKYNHRFIQE